MVEIGADKTIPPRGESSVVGLSKGDGMHRSLFLFLRFEADFHFILNLGVKCGIGF